MDVADRVAILELLPRYADAFDQGRFDDLAPLFTHDARFEIIGATGGLPAVMDGRDAIVAALTARYDALRPIQRRHLVANVVVTPRDETHATLTASLLLGSVASGSLTLPTTGRYEDEVRHVDGRWRIHRQVLTLDAPVV